MPKSRKERKTLWLDLKKWVIFLGAVGLFFVSGKLVLSYRKRLWQRGRFNLVVNTRPVLVVSLFENKTDLTVVTIPENTYLEATRGYGLYKIGSVYSLGQMEGKGGQLLAETTQEFLAIPVRAYINLGDTRHATRDTINKEEVLDLRKQITSWGIFLRPQKVYQFLTKDLETNLSFWDLAKIWLAVKKTSLAEVNFFDLEKSQVLKEFALPDGQIGKKAEPILVDNLLKEFFFDPEIRKEAVPIKLLNGTEHPGLAERVARMATNLGVKVSEVGNSPERVEKCQLKGGRQALNSQVAEEIQKIFGCQKSSAEGKDLTLIIGENYFKKLNLGW